MNFFEIVFFGWYQILDKTIYSGYTEEKSFGPKEHSFFITFLIHGINLWTIVRYLIVRYFKLDIPLYLSFLSAILIFLLGYLFFFRTIKVKMMMYKIDNLKAFFFIAIAIAYFLISAYCMIIVGDFARFHLGS